MRGAILSIRCLSIPLYAVLISVGLHAAEPSPPHDGAHPAPATPGPGMPSASRTSSQPEQIRGKTQPSAYVIGHDWPEPVEDSMWFKSILVEQLEYRMKDDDDTVRWDGEAWYGADYDRLWLKTEGEWRTTGERGGEAEVQALYGRLIAPFWDLQIGVRYDQLSSADVDRSRGFAVIGIEGLAPYWVEIDGAFFVSQDGDVSARLTAGYELLLTQRLVLQPRVDIDAAGQSVEDFGVGEGINSVGVGLRLRYEVIREVAPYVGVQYLGRLGETADLARSAGEGSEEIAGVIGIHVMF